MGVAIADGMFSSTLVVPVFYLILDEGVDWLHAHLRRQPCEPDEPVATKVD